MSVWALHSAQNIDRSNGSLYFRGIQHQTVQELEKQVELLRERNSQLQYTVKEQEEQIEALKQKLKNTGDEVSNSQPCSVSFSLNPHEVCHFQSSPKPLKTFDILLT